MSEDVPDRLERLREKWTQLGIDSVVQFVGADGVAKAHPVSVDYLLDLISAAPALIAVARAAEPLLDQVACDTFCAVCHGPRPWAHNQHIQGCPVPAAQAALEALRDE